MHKNLQTIHENINTDMATLDDWFKANKLSLNISKTNYVIFRPSNRILPDVGFDLNIGLDKIERKSSVKFLGMVLDENLKWSPQIQHVGAKMYKSHYLINSLKTVLPRSELKTLYYTMIYPYLTYGIEVWGSAQKEILNKINVLQRKVVRCIGRAKYNDHALPIFKSMHFLQLNDIYELHVLKYMHAYIQKDLPSPIIQLFTRNTEIHDHNTRQNVNPHVQIRHTSSAAKSIVHCGPMLWSKLPNNLKTTCSKKAFIKRYKKHILTNY